ncbi:DUF3667 domain-containing protein [Cryomorphaceae bacterium 1068]|nr:DUF3667 domain-containing protein [Cryomorphaceae bacterium 1068]
MGEIKKYLPQCLNCGNDLKATDQFCAQCGQRTKGAKVPLGDFIGDFFQDYFTVDSKFFKSILLLMVRPGRLTKEFNEGKRKSYIAPLRMYLFTSFIYFFLLSISVNNDAENMGFTTRNVENQKALILDSLLAAENDTILVSDVQIVVDSLQTDDQVESFISIEEDEFDKGGVEEYMYEQVEKANNDPKSFVRSLFRVASISLFFLVPIFGLVLWLFHFRRNSFYVQHLVQALHIHTFVFAILSIYLLISFWIEVETFSIIPLLLLIYFIWSLKVVYGQKLLPSFLKALAILIVYFVIVLIAIVPAIMLAIVTV